MRVLATSAQLSKEVSRLIGECSSCEIAVAWASTGFEAFDLLEKNASKITKAVVGTHFFQTDPRFIERFLLHPNVRFVRDTVGVFHPKVYMFDKVGDKWECVVGSSNFTKGGFCRNAEVAIHITEQDQGSDEAKNDLKNFIDSQWQKAAHFTEAALEEYRTERRQKEPFLDTLRGKPTGQLNAESLIQFARTLQHMPLPTLASRGTPIEICFSLTVTSRGLEFVPMSSKGGHPHVSPPQEVQRVCEEYERLGRTKTTTRYTGLTRASSYLLTIIDLFEADAGPS